MAELHTYINIIRDSSIQIVSNLDENDTFMQSYLNSAAPKSSAAGVYHRAEKKMNELTCRIYNWATSASALERSNIGVEEFSSLVASIKEIKSIHDDNRYLIDKMNGGPKVVHDNYPINTFLIEELRTSLQELGKKARLEELRDTLQGKDQPMYIGGGDGIEG